MNKFLKILAVFGGAGISAFVVYRGSFSSSSEIILNGNVELQDVKVSFRTQGRVKEIQVEEGEEVKEGQVLAVLETDILEAQVQLASAELLEATSHLNNCKKDFNRSKELYEKHSISEKTYDDVRGRYEIAQAGKEKALAKYNLATISKNDAVVRSPVSGTIISKNIEIGEMINPHSPAFSIMPDTQKKIKTYANAEILQYLKVGDKVIVESLSTKSKKFKGYVAFISSESEFTPKNIETKELRTSLVYRVRIIIDEEERGNELKHGMPVSIHIL